MSLTLLLTAASFLVPAPAEKPEGWTGQVVMQKRTGTSYRVDQNIQKSSGNLLMIEYRVIRDAGEEVVVFENGKEVFVRKEAMIPQSEAIAYFSEVIQKEPSDANAYAFRGWANKQKKNFESALDDYSKAIDIAPNQCAWRNNRALIWIEKKDYDKAIADYDEALRLFPQYGLAFRNRGHCWLKKKEYANALKDFEKSAELDLTSPHALNSLARLLATCPDDKIRNGEKALEHAKKACEMSEWINGWLIDTLAAANAEIGKFDEAIKYQEKAFADPFYTREKKDVEEARKRLQLYRDRKPFRDVPK
ncbi:MAG: tetratricopeptide repeat protein [Planctomycetes bacterium]|nr:tetratricopeptide repeat protein [Planctomycetota bacterium]